jgi:putative membrane protein
MPASVDSLFDGVIKLDEGIKTANEAQTRIGDGAAKLSTGVTALTTGVRTMNAGIRSMSSHLPEDSALDELDTGANALTSGLTTLDTGAAKVRAGAERLDTGINLLVASLPATIDGPEGSAQGLANSVQPLLEFDAPVANSGSAFAPNIIPAALWLGAGVVAFLVHLRVLPKHAQHFSRPAQLMGKLLIPMGLVLLQAGLVYVTMVWGLHVKIASPVHCGVTLALASATFLAIVFALNRALGDAGKALAMILLALQLSSSGGIMPVELSGGLFSEISPWLPLTWVVRDLKTSMFNAYGGDWLHPLLIVGTTGLLALCSACWIGRWRFAQPAQVRPAIDF